MNRDAMILTLGLLALLTYFSVNERQVAGTDEADLDAELATFLAEVFS